MKTDSRGETLVEVLASILIAALSAALLFSCIASSVRINRSAQAADAAHYQALSAAEGQTDALEGVNASITIQGENSGQVEIDIDLYGGEGLYSYSKKEGAGP